MALPIRRAMGSCTEPVSRGRPNHDAGRTARRPSLRVGIDRADDLGTYGAGRRVHIGLDHDHDADCQNDDSCCQCHPLKCYQTFLVTEKPNETVDYAVHPLIFHLLLLRFK